uniref:Uncharacterized protein n=1 Tax=Lotharella vacuolata TaxID=74820 RepID=A0A0H5BQS4_9EUKA|nr:hypothetical protein [Lotharella vacuolata]
MGQIYIKKILIINIKKTYKKKNLIIFFTKNFIEIISNIFKIFMVIKKKYWIFYTKLFLNLKSLFIIQVYFLCELNTIKANIKPSEFEVTTLNNALFNNIVFNELLRLH